MKINIKALSINAAWAGKRFKTPAYKSYEEELLYRLPSNVEIPEGDLQAWYVFGVSSKASDVDNLIKAFQDCLQKKYNFDDKRVCRIIADKHYTKKGEEYIAFDIKSISSQFTNITKDHEKMHNM